MTADRSAPARVVGGWRIVLVVVGLVLMAIGASQAFAWMAYKLGILPVGLWHVLEHGGTNGFLGENLGASIGRGLTWVTGFVVVSVVVLGIVRRRAAHRLPVAVVVLGVVLMTSWVVLGRAGLAHDDARQGFQTLRPALDDIAERALRGDLDGHYAELPRTLDFVSVNGSVDVFHKDEDPDAVTIFVPVGTAGRRRRRLHLLAPPQTRREHAWLGLHRPDPPGQGLVVLRDESRIRINTQVKVGKADEPAHTPGSPGRRAVYLAVSDGLVGHREDVGVLRFSGSHDALVSPAPDGLRRRLCVPMCTDAD